MKIDRKLYLVGFEIGYLPSWICPECKAGNLHPPEDGIKTFEYPSSKKLYFEEGEPEWIRGCFTGTLVCSNKKCNCTAVISGDMFVEPVPESVPGYPGEHEMVPREHIAIKYFNPPLEIIAIPDYLKDEKIILCLRKSFTSFWADSSSCANKIRITVEAIMDERGIPKNLTNKKGEAVYYPLHAKIKAFEKTNPEVAELLLAIKWIGNDGSHELEELTREDVLIAYEILQQSLDKLYNTRPAELQKIAQEINKNKEAKK